VSMVQPVQTLTRPASPTYQLFGTSIAIDGGYLLVLAINEHSGHNTYAALLYRRSVSDGRWLYRRTLVGRAFLAISEDNYAARALGLPEQRLRIASYALAGMIGVLAGFTGGQMMLAYFGNGPQLNFYGFVPVALGGMGSNRGAVAGGLALGLFQQAASFLVGGIFASVAVFVVFIVVLLARPEGFAGAATARRV